MEHCVGMRLALDGKKTMVIDEESLVLNDPGINKTQRFACGFTASRASPKYRIPLYNILWATLSNGKVLIDFASPSSQTSLKCERSYFALPSRNEDAEETAPDIFISALLARAYGLSKLRKKAFVLINPAAGPGDAERRWENEVKPLFEAARMEFAVVTLRRGGEAADVVEHIDISKCDTIVACSGDGTPHEIFNGLARRKDAGAALSQIAVSHIPCGSGNAMSLNLYGSNSASISALAIIKGIVTPLDLVSITQGNRRIISFLSQALGIIAESDLCTEHLRWMGSKRFDVGVLMRIFSQKCYPCDLAIKVEADKEGVKEHYKRCVKCVAPERDATEKSKQADYGTGLPPLLYGTVQDTLPSGWKLVARDNIGNFYCGNMAYMAPNLSFFPAAVPADGCMDLVTINGDLSPFTAAKTLLSVESGQFFDNPHVSYKKISAYRIIPREQDDGYISIDGEKVPFEPFQAEIHQGLGRVLSKTGRFEAPGPVNWENLSMTEVIPEGHQ